MPQLIFRPQSYVHPLDLGGLFGREAPLEIELGSGDGGFLAQWAAQHPETNFIGVERLLGRLRKLEKKGLRAHLQNLRLLRIEASYLLQYLVPPSSVTALHIYFPDPWPKRKHVGRQLINPSFVRVIAQALKAGGKVYLRTDDEAYFQTMTNCFALESQFSPTTIPIELAAISTEFERGFIARGAPVRRAAYERL